MIHMLLERLRSIDFGSLSEDDIDEILDSRDEGEFDEQWCRVYEETARLKNESNYTAENRREHDSICKEAFMAVGSGISSELSDYVADDFGLIYDSIILGYNDDWLSALIEEYSSGRLPSGKK